jgi:hypothetical protein
LAEFTQNVGLKNAASTTINRLLKQFESKNPNTLSLLIQAQNFGRVLDSSRSEKIEKLYKKKIKNLTDESGSSQYSILVNASHTGAEKQTAWVLSHGIPIYEMQVSTGKGGTSTSKNNNGVYPANAATPTGIFDIVASRSEFTAGFGQQIKGRKKQPNKYVKNIETAQKDSFDTNTSGRTITSAVLALSAKKLNSNGKQIPGLWYAHGADAENTVRDQKPASQGCIVFDNINITLLAELCVQQGERAKMSVIG